MIIKDKKLTGRHKRMQHFKDMHARAGLNLVSLMDIFTILVFFLLVNTSAQQLPSHKDIKLPTSVSLKTPKETLVITISQNSIVVAGHKITDLKTVLGTSTPIITSLVNELNYQTDKHRNFRKDTGKIHQVTIMGDQNIPYRILKKVLASCRQANYNNISFAAYQKKKGHING